MKIRSVITARAGRYVRASVRDSQSLFTNIWGHVYLPDLVRDIKERYGFVGAPQALYELEVSDSSAASFKHGKFVRETRSVLIKTLEVYANWVIATTESSTDDADAFLSDLLTWLSGTYFTVTSYSYVTYYSQLEVVLEANFGTAARFLSSPRSKLAGMLSSYNNLSPPKFEMSGFSLNYDTVERKEANWGGFTIERRSGHSYPESVYFTQAPLKTEDHILILSEIEQALKGS